MAFVPRRPRLSVPQFGAWLSELWAEHSYEQIAIKLRPFVKEHGLKVDRSSIKKLELGRVPNWPMVFAISQAFDVPVMDTTARLLRALPFAEVPKEAGLVRPAKQQPRVVTTAPDNLGLQPSTKQSTDPSSTAGAHGSISSVPSVVAAETLTQAISDLQAITQALAKELGRLAGPRPRGRPRRPASAARLGKSRKSSGR